MQQAGHQEQRTTMRIFLQLHRFSQHNVDITQQTFANWKTNSLGDKSSVSTAVSSANLFTSTASGNLNINPNNFQCWYVAGFRTPLTTPQVLNDYEQVHP